MDLLQCLMDSSSHAIFPLDREGIITHFNPQAKVRVGLYHNSQHPHPAGRLEPGDLVLIADTAIGADDGALRPEDLARIGIREPRLRVNDRLVAAGVFDMPGRRPVYKFLPDQDADSLCLETVCEGIPIRLSIERRSVTVTVRDTVYTIGYFRCIGQMVVLDGATGRVKFWQEKGYSARREGIGHLLRGGSYSENGPGCPSRWRAITSATSLRGRSLSGISPGCSTDRRRGLRTGSTRSTALSWWPPFSPCPGRRADARTE